jgi:hypothetical protein
MTRFLDLRVSPGGPPLAKTVAINHWTGQAYQSMLLSDLQTDIRGMDVLIGTHGFNVNRQDGINSLSSWESLLQLGSNGIFVGLLWPGDSVWLHALSYPEEPKIANEAGQLIGPWVDANFAEAASISFASHSLGARVILETIATMSRRVRRCTLMAGAIDDNCFNREFRGTGDKIDEISVLASKQDAVLADAFPIGNVLGGIIAAEHPWYRTALGRSGPSNPWPSNLKAPFHIPNDWSYGHGSYLHIDAAHPSILPDTSIPQDDHAPKPAGGAEGWQEAFSASFVSAHFK